LPCYVGDGHPLLERLTQPIREIEAEYWIIVHRDLRRSACVRAVIDWMKALFCHAARRTRRCRLGLGKDVRGVQRRPAAIDKSLRMTWLLQI
jgi:hypothetical protein